MDKKRIDVLRYAIKTTTSEATYLVLKQELDRLLAAAPKRKGQQPGEGADL